MMQYRNFSHAYWQYLETYMITDNTRAITWCHEGVADQMIDETA